MDLRSANANERLVNKLSTTRVHRLFVCRSRFVDCWTASYLLAREIPKKKNERFQTPHQHSPHSPHSRVSALNSVDGKFMWLLYSRERAIRSSSADGIENDIEKYLNNLNDQAFLADCLLSFGFFFDYWGLMMMVRWQINKQRQFVNNGWSFSSTRRA